MEISLLNALCLVKIWKMSRYFLHNADVFLIEAANKRKTNSHRELLLATLIVQVVCSLFLWSEKKWNTFVSNWMRKGECSLIEANICQCKHGSNSPYPNYHSCCQEDWVILINENETIKILNALKRMKSSHHFLLWGEISCKPLGKSSHFEEHRERNRETEK